MMSKAGHVAMHIISSVVQENTKAGCIDVTDPVREVV